MCDGNGEWGWQGIQGKGKQNDDIVRIQIVMDKEPSLIFSRGKLSTQNTWTKHRIFDRHQPQTEPLVSLCFHNDIDWKCWATQCLIDKMLYFKHENIISSHFLQTAFPLRVDVGPLSVSQNAVFEECNMESHTWLLLDLDKIIRWP